MANKKNFNNIGINDFFSDNDYNNENKRQKDTNKEHQENNENTMINKFMDSVKKNNEPLSRTYTFYLTDKAIDLISKAADKKKISRSKLVEEMTIYLLSNDNP